MHKFASRAKHGLCVLSALPLIFAMATASAAGPSDLSPAVRAAMQRDLGLSSAQLSQYLKIERLAETQQQRLAKAEERLATCEAEEAATTPTPTPTPTTTV